MFGKNAVALMDDVESTLVGCIEGECSEECGVEFVSRGAHYAVWGPDGVLFATALQLFEVGCAQGIVDDGFPSSAHHIGVSDSGEGCGVVSVVVLPELWVCYVHSAVGVHSDEDGV